MNQSHERLGGLVVEYVRAVVRHVYFLLVGLVGAALTVLSLVLPTVVRVVGFGLLAFGLIGAQFLAWREIRDERDKSLRSLADLHSSLRFTFSLSKVFWELSPGDGTVNVQIGLVFENTSTAVLEYEIQSIAVIVNERTVLDPGFHTRGTRIPVGRDDMFRFPFITAIDYEPGTPLTAEIEFAAAYGLPGELKYRLRRRIISEALAQPGENYPGYVRFFDVDPPREEFLS
jgi:hypothetical protein